MIMDLFCYYVCNTAMNIIILKWMLTDLMTWLNHSIYYSIYIAVSQPEM